MLGEVKALTGLRGLAVLFMLMMLVTILLSYISFKVVEEPLYGLRHRMKVI